MSRSSCIEPAPAGPDRRRLLLLLGALALAGCGVKGRLQLPEGSSSADSPQDEVVREEEGP